MTAATPTPELPSLDAPGTPAEVLAKLETAARRGRLAGFNKTSASTFFCDAYGEPFESDLLGSITQVGERSRISFAVKLRTRLPLIFLATSIFSIWPGVWLMDSLMLTYFPGFTASVPTAWWYLPLTVLPLPYYGVKSMRKSKVGAQASAHEMIAKVASELGANQS